jgi:radical SAM protein with 4Fe4S-binding SPASM domain
MLALDPKFKLRKTKTNILLYRYDPDLMDLQDQKLLHPNTAILLSFFNGENTIENIKNTYYFVLNTNEEVFSETFDKFIADWRPFMIDTDKRVRWENPNDFIIRRENVDLTETLCCSPLYLAISVTQRCMADCIYCYAERKGPGEYKEMTGEHIDSIMEQASQIGVEFIVLSGGDPFIRDDILDIIEMGLSRSIPINVSTKKYLKSETIIKLNDLGLKRMQVSVDCLDDNISRNITGITDHASLALSTIQRLLAGGIEVSTNSVITSMNIDKIPSLISHLSQIGVTIIRLSQYVRSAYRHKDDLFITYEKASALRDFVENFNACNGRSRVIFSNLYDDLNINDEEKMVRFLDRGQCSFGRVSFMISPDGKIIPCEQLPCDDRYILGDTTEQSIQEIWDSCQVDKFMRPERSCFNGTTCFDCQYYDACIPKKGWCSRDVWKAYNTVYQVQPQCPRSKETPGRRLF